MPRRDRSIRCELALLFGFWAAGIAGCGEQVIRIETQIHPDGSLDRAFCQPRETIPAEALAASQWTGVIRVRPVAAGPTETPIRELTTPDKESEATSVAAWGAFKKLGELPEHYWHPSVEGREPGRLRPELELVDLGLISVGTWRETLNDEVTVEDQRAACQDAADLAARILPATIEQWFKTERDCEVDAARLADWMRTDGARLLGDLTFEVYDGGHRKKRLSRDAEYFDLRTLAVLRRHFHRLSPNDPPSWGSESRAQEISRYIEDLLEKSVRTPDGGSIEREQFRRFLEVNRGEPDPTLSPPSTKESLTELKGRLDGLLEKVLTDEFGGGESGAMKRDAELAALRTRILGMYQFGVPPVRFNCQLDVPGHIISTNGDLTDVGHVEWNFKGEDAFPTAFVMECVWVGTTHTAKMPETARESLKKPRNLVSLLRLIRENEKLAAAVKECAKTGDLKPLTELQQATFPSNERKPLDRALELLEGKNPGVLPVDK